MMVKMIQLAEMVLLLFVGEVICTDCYDTSNLPCAMMHVLRPLSQLAAHDKAILSLASNDVQKEDTCAFLATTDI